MSEDKLTLRILIAEDDVNLGEALRSFLKDQGHLVDLARHGGEALKLLRKNRYHLILADLVMPEADGLAVLRAARQQDPGTLVVIMTGHASLASALQATREGAYSYLRKPFNLQEIEVAVTNAICLLRLKQENLFLTQKLQELKAKLQEMREGENHPASAPPLPDRSPRSRTVALCHWGPLLPWETPAPPQADLERLLGLYRENLLTEKEFQILRDRLLVSV